VSGHAFVSYWYRLCLFLWFFYCILEPFPQCGHFFSFYCTNNCQQETSTIPVPQFNKNTGLSFIEHILVMSSVLGCPLRLPHVNDVRFVFTSSCLWVCSCILRYLWLIVYSGIQHIFCCVFVLFFYDLCTLCCQFLWIVHCLLPLWCSLAFIVAGILLPCHLAIIDKAYN
jgi:hypothetical protein